MKKLLLLALVIFMANVPISFGQTNLFPSTGNAGVGTISPTARLFINAPSSTNTPAFQISSSGTLANNDIVRFQINGLTNGFRMFQDNSSKLIYSFIDGNVGIGTTDPKTPLDVAGGITVDETQASGVRFSRSYDVHGHIYVDPTQGYLLNYKGYYGHKFQTSIGEVFRITQNGNVGIGTNNPENSEGWYKVLDVFGSGHSKIIATTTEIQTGMWSHNSGFFNSPSGGLIGTKTNHPLSIITGGTNRLIITDTGNVGIGTTTPTSKFHAVSIAPDTQPVALFQNTNASGFAGIQIDRSSIVRYALSQYSTGNTVDWNTGVSYNGGAANSAYSIGTGISLSDSKLTILNAGNVGIGTTAPFAKLDVFGGILNSTLGNKLEVARFMSNNGNSSLLRIFNNRFTAGTDWNSSSTRIQQTIDVTDMGYLEFNPKDSPFGLALGSYSGEIMRLTDGGNIGIGTKTPTAKLEIASATGSGLKLSGLSQVNVQAGATRTLGVNDAGEVIVKNNNSTDQIAPSNISLTSLEKNVLFYAHKRFKYSQTGSAKLDEALLFDGSFEPSYTNTAPSETDPTVILLENLPEYHVQRGVWIGWSTRYWATTKFKIEVFDTWNYSGNANYNKWITIADESNYSGTDYKVFLPTSSVYPVISKIRFTFYKGNSDNGRLGVSELFYLSPEISKAYDGFLAKLNPDGNLGIGTSSPTQKLEIRGNSGSPASSGINQNGIVSISSNDTYGTLHMGNNISSPYGFWLQSAGRNDLSINYPLLLNPNGGNIGIGTTTPTAKLHLQGTQFKQNDETGSYGFTLNTTSATSRLITMFGGSSFAIQTGGGAVDNFTVNSAGNVGIGTTTPTAPLEVNGNANFSSGNLVRAIAFFYNNKFNIQANSNSSGLDIGTTTASPISFYTNGVTSPKMTISGDGNVSIGTTSMPAGYKLAIAGDMIAERVVVKLQANWPDYVFKTGYSLRPLSEVENFVKVNNHLPDVPSEAEVKAKGIDVEQMNATLLKKMEELTLYMIELQKQNDVLKKRMDSLDKK